MSWIDDLKTRAEQAVSNVQKDIGTYLQERVIEPVIKVGDPQGGNLTAAQIAAGARGGQGGIPASNQPASALMNANPLANVSASLMQYLPLLILAGAAVMIFKKGRK
jgi:succinyl-CoA synthetase beta subunit